jgi:hypothetical protein
MVNQDIYSPGTLSCNLSNFRLARCTVFRLDLLNQLTAKSINIRETRVCLNPSLVEP